MIAKRLIEWPGVLIFTLILLGITSYGLNYQVTKTLLHVSGLLSLVAIVSIFIKQYVNTSRGEFYPRPKPGLVVFSLLLLSAAAIVWIQTTGIDNQTSYRFSHDFITPALCAAFIALIAKSNEASFKAIQWLLPVATLSMAIPGISDYYSTGQSWNRVSGSIDLPIIYASNLTALACASLLIGLTADHKAKPVLVVLCIIAFIAGLWGVTLSGSRTPALSALLVSVAIIGVVLLKRTGVWKTLIILCLLAASLVFASSQLLIGDRMLDAVRNIESNKQSSSIGIRFELWRGALDGIMEEPIKGVGVGKHNEYFESKLKSDPNYIHSSARNFIHLHNDILNATVWMGIPAALVFLSFIAWPLIFGWLYRRTIGGALCLITSCVFIINGFSNTPSIRATSLTLFLTMTIIGAAIAYYEKEKLSAS